VVSQREAAAYHEAGHAVAAMTVGWSINPEGVEIDRRQFCGYRMPVFMQDDEASTVFVCQAGWLSEWQWHHRGDQYRSDDAFECDLAEARWGDSDIGIGDDIDAFIHLLRLYPKASDKKLIRIYRKYEQETARLLTVSETQSAIERVAKQLIRHGAITYKQAHRAAGFEIPKWAKL
jgi:hypothetical protein